ncbi:MAG TPA: VOC family protein [Candidatus Solibacter sp.]|jgi:PhnB protein|nr:VOC family protein [Candidatus Solibacter sp.]
MKNNVKAIPEGYHTVTPYLIVDGAARLIEFVKQAFDAKEMLRMSGPDGRIGHTEIRIGDSMLMLSDSRDPWKPMPAMLYLYVEDVDATYQRALQAGATSVSEPKDQFYGDRSAGVQDSCGNQWWIGTHIEDVSEEELLRRHEAAMAAH